MATTAEAVNAAYKGVLPGPRMFLGNGKETTGTFRTVEGALDINIKHQSNALNAFMSVRIEFDTNGDHIWAGDRDSAAWTVWHGAYDQLKNLDVDVTHSFHFYGGEARFVVEAPGNWQVKVTAKPAPRRTLSGVVWEETVQNGKGTGRYSFGGAKIVATSRRGDRFETAADQFGAYSLTVYGDTDYAVSASKPGYRSSRVSLPVRRFSEQENLGWPIKVDHRMPFDARLQTVERGTPEAKSTSIFGAVTYKKSGKPVEHELVVLLDAKTSKRVAKAEVRRGDGARFEFEKLAPGDYTVSAGGAMAPYTDKSSVQVARGLEEGERREVNLKLEPSSLTVRGGVYALDGRSRQKAIKYAKVSVKFPDGKVVDTHTDHAGQYSVKRDEAPKSYALLVELKDKDNIVTILDHSGFGGNLVKMRTYAQRVDRAVMRTNIFFMPNYAKIDGSHTTAQRVAFRHAGAYYANLMDAVDFGRNKLSLKYDHQLPVDHKLFSPGNKPIVAYYMATSTVVVSRAGNKSLASALDSPDNREHHEFGHHVQTDATMGGANAMDMLAQGDDNHRGVNNSNSLDSVTEGFAEFYSMMVRNSIYYRWSGIVSNLQRNTHMWPGVNKPLEEFNVAALLWDIYDKDTEAGDYFALGVKGTWAILNQTKVKTVRDIYEIMDAKYKKQDTNKKDGLNDVDALFVAHSFFGDTNGNKRFDKGEP
ncbi:hypothetical protein HQ560_11540, partial [bacterium]|nr:hypothetical protein [bacterium]